MILERLKEQYGEKSVFLTSSDHTGCSRGRIVYPYQFLKDSFETIDFNEGYPTKDPRTLSDVLWLQRPTHEYFLDFIPKRKAEGKHTIIDLDDILHDIPVTNLAHKFYPKKELNKVDAVFKLADVLTTSTKPLADFLEDRYKKKVFIIPNHLWKHESFIPDTPKPKNEKIKIGWQGSYVHNGDFDVHLVNVLRGLPKDKVEFYSMGFTPQFFKDFAISIPWVKTEDFHTTFRDQNWDIGILVSLTNRFSQCKSNLKYLQYSGSKTASVGHVCYPYSNTIEHGVDGLLIDNPKTQWKEFIYRLIEDEPYRLSLAENAYKKVNSQFTYDENFKSLEDTYLEIFDYLYKN